MRDGSKLICHICQNWQVRFPGFSFKSPKFTLLNCKFLWRFYFQFSNLRHGSRFRLVVTPTEISVCLGYAEKSAIVVVRSSGFSQICEMKKLPFADVSPNLDCAPSPSPYGLPSWKDKFPFSFKIWKNPPIIKT